MTGVGKDKVKVIVFTILASLGGLIVPSYLDMRDNISKINEKMLSVERRVAEHGMTLSGIPVVEMQVSQLAELRKEELKAIHSLSESVNKLSITVARLEEKVEK